LLKAAHYVPPREQPDDDYPLFLTTGRIVYHFHTRSKTARCAELQAAAPDVFVELSAADAKDLQIAAGELVEVTSRRGTILGAARIGEIPKGQVFVPFHYGDWGSDGRHHRAANELTLTDWDPLSKQPHFKFAAVRVRKAKGILTGLTDRIAETAEVAVERGKEIAHTVSSAMHTPRTHLGDKLGHLSTGLEELGAAARELIAVHTDESELVNGFTTLARVADQARERLMPIADKYEAPRTTEPSALRKAVFPTSRPGAYGALKDLHALALLAADAYGTNTMVSQAAQAERDPEFMSICGFIDEQLRRQQAWLHTQILHRAPHTLTVPT
jgi:formylmethanofuran dehydrogenase subunit D